MPADHELIEDVKRELEGRELRPRDQMTWGNLLMFVVFILVCYTVIHFTFH